MNNVNKSSKSSKFLGSLVVTFFAVTGVFYMLFSSAATPGTPAYGIYLSPVSSNVTNGSRFDVKVYANFASVPGLNNISAFVHYDPAQLKLVAADQANVPNNLPVKFWCSPVEGCQTAGNVAFTEGFAGNATISPADGVLVGNMTFEAIKTGTATITLDPDTQLTGFTPIKDDPSTNQPRQIQNASFNVTASTTGGGTTNTGGGTANTNTTTGTPSTKTSTGTKTTTSNTSTGTSAGTSSGSSTTTPTDTNNQPVVAGSTADDQNSGGGTSTSSSSAVPQKKTSKALILAASMAVSAIIVGTLALLFSEPVRTRIAHLFHHGGQQFVAPNDPLVMGGPGNTVSTPPSTISHNNDASENVVIHPTGAPVTSEHEVPSSIHPSTPNTGDSATSNPTPIADEESDNIIRPTQPPTA